ncbi:unnamed protein product [Adineta ricciae]|uniref:Sialate O-acetylesterase domain-containing protein n=1 Tax=Adineta ricciae TaxID=249248 RepID=A0A814SPX3_ADIRI|nr:unnamed protein product [Adineta ricciae]
MNKLYLVGFLIAFFFLRVDGTVRFANYYQNHMVLQRAPQRAIVWGYVEDFNAPIVLTMNRKIYRTRSSSSAIDRTGESIWSVTLDAQSEEGPFSIDVHQPLPNGTIVTITLHDVLFGDVWICSGQSNMTFAVRNMFNGSIEIENADKYPKIRLFTASRQQSSTPEEELLAIALPWSVASADSVGSPYTSAVCWLYGRMVQEELDGRPIGLVHTSWGGTAVELWSPPQVLKDCGISRNSRVTIEEDNQLDIVLNNTVLYNAMIHPFTRMVIKGALWYQGEANVNFNRDKYKCTFSKMIQYWRSIWHERTTSNTDSTFPFGFVQLSTREATGNVIGGFPWIRWHQTFDVGYVPNDVLPNVFMATAMDLRDDKGGIHPRNKLDVGYRLSRSGLAIAYNLTNIPYQGPIIVDFSIIPHTHQIQVMYSDKISRGVHLRNTNGFEICCIAEDVCKSNETVWVTAPASEIKGSPLSISLTIPSPCISKKLFGYRYLWRETPCAYKEAAVYNIEDQDIPAAPYIHFF